IRGTTTVELTSGLHWYLKYWCDAHVSRNKTGGIQVASDPKARSLPRLKGKGVMIQRPVPWNYYQNVVTFLHLRHRGSDDISNSKSSG
ncbi:hypothetical protein ACJRO7_029410, partial [Eucalyptus globulus]